MLLYETTIMELIYVVAHFRGLKAVYMKLFPHARAVAIHATNLIALHATTTIVSQHHDM
jgi:hypothetical protein